MQRRPGTKLIYEGKPGEEITLLPNGFAVVTHPDRPPKIVHPDGHVEPLDPILR